MPRLPGVRRFFRLPSAERDVVTAVDDELTFHVDMLTEQLVAAGRPRDEARAEAMRRFGDLDRVRDRCRDISGDHETAVRRAERWGALGQDVRYAARGIRRAPGFALLVLATLTLGIGATTTMFSVVRGVLLRPLPFPEAERVVRIWPDNQLVAQDRRNVSPLELEDWARELRGFAAIGGFSFDRVGTVFGDGPEPSYVPTTNVSAGFFPTLRASALLGRTFTDAEHAVGANHVAVVSHAFWRSQLGGDPRAVGRTIRLGGGAFTVVGVMRPEFAYPHPSTGVWLPSSLIDSTAVCCGRDARFLGVIGRLRPGVTPEGARAEVQALLARLAAMYPESNRGWTGAELTGVRDAMVGTVRRGLLVLLGAVGLVLLVVCANVANLILVRGTARARELALRGAIGAGRARVVRLLLTESVLLALGGGLLGTLAAWGAVRALVSLSGDFLPRAADVRLDLGVLAFAVALSLATGVLFGLWPALRATSGMRLASVLREGGRGAVGGGAAQRARSALVTAEVALAVVLVVGAGLMLRSFHRLTSADPGFRAENVLLVKFGVPFEESAGPRKLAADRERVVERVRAVPGVVAAGATTYAPLTSGAGEPRPFVVPGRPAPPQGEEPRVLLQPATRGYLRTMGIPLLAGEDLEAVAGDTTSGAFIVISRRMAEQVWPGASPIGETITIANRPARIIGVAGDVRSTRLDSLGGFTAYIPDRRMPRVAMSLVVRTASDPVGAAAAVRAAVREVFPGQAFQEVVPLRDKLAEAASTPRLFTSLVAVFGALALALAAVGLYGVVSFVVRQREREIAVRVALGAPRAGVLALVVRQGMAPVAVGLAIGLLGALAVTRVLRSLLFEVSVTDPATFAAVAALLGAVALAASYLPSRRAARVDPAVTLRAE